MEIATVNLIVADDQSINMSANEGTEINLSVDASTGGGTTDYNKLANKPSINGKVLQGDVSVSEIGALDSRDEITNTTVTSMWNAIVD